MDVTRRTLLLALACCAVPACSSTTSSPSDPVQPVSTSTPPTATPTTPEPTGTADLTATAHPISRKTLIQRYSGEEPTAWGEAVPGVVQRLPTSDRVIALTLDACGGPAGSGYDAALIETLRREGVPATLFVNARWIEANPQQFRQLAADPLFEIANHGTAHRPLSVTGRSAYGIPGTAGVPEAIDEVSTNQASPAARQRSNLW